MLSFTQINLHKARQATQLVGLELGEKRQSIVLMTEPHTYANKLTGMPNGTKKVMCGAKNEDPVPRASIVASLDVGLTAMDNWCNRDCAVALTRIGGRQTIIVSLYLDVKLDVQPAWLDRLMEMIETKNYPAIIGVDSNAHSTLYGPDTNTRGASFEDFILSYGLNVENRGNAPTFEVRRGNNMVETHIDVSLTRGLTAQVQNWRVDREYNASDHNTIRFEVATTKPEPQLVRPWGKADWRKFSSLLSKADYGVPRDMSMKKLDKLVEKVYKLLKEALDEACPLTKVTPRAGKSHWANEKHDEGKAKVNKLYKKAKSSRNAGDWEVYKQADKDFKRMCKNDKNKAWRKYKESIQSEKEMAQLAKASQWEERKDINVLTKPDGTSTDPGAETINMLTTTHFPAATDTKHVTYNNRRNLPVKDIDMKYKDLSLIHI